MKLKPTLKYQLAYQWKSFLLLYLFVLFIELVGLILTFHSRGATVDGYSSGLEVLTILFLVVLSLTQVREPLRFFCLNSRTRWEFFKSTVTALLFTSFAAAVIDTLNGQMLYEVMRHFSGGYSYYPLYYQIWAQHFNPQMLFSSIVPTFPSDMLLRMFLWDFSTYSLFCSACFTIGILYFRMNRITKIIAAAGIPIILILSSKLAPLAALLLGFTAWWFGLAVEPLWHTVSRLLVSAFFAALAWLALRRAEIRK